jgi:hypothetical protein
MYKITQALPDTNEYFSIEVSHKTSAAVMQEALTLWTDRHDAHEAYLLLGLEAA